MKNGFIVERFNGISALVKTITKRKPNKVFANACKSASENGSEKFTHTSSYAEATEIMTAGYKDGLTMLQQGKGIRVRPSSNAPKHMPYNSVVGFAPHVPNAIAGIPQSMIATTCVKMKSRIINLVYDGGAHCHTTTHDIIAAGQTVLNVIMALEMQGYRVQLSVMNAFIKNNQKAIVICTLKDHRQPINPLKTAYPLIHPSYLRRHTFRWLETQPEITENFPDGYGQTISDKYDFTTEQIREWLRKNEIIDDNTFYTNFYEAKGCTPKQLIDKMGLKK